MNARFIPVRSLGVARVLLGTLFLVRTTPVLRPLGIVFLHDTWPLLGWPPVGWHVAALGWALPRGVVAGLCVARTLAAVAFVLGVQPRRFGIIAGGLGYLVLSQDTLAYFNSLHLLYAATILLAVAGSGANLALRPEPARSPESGVWLVRAFVASVYIWSGVAKLHAHWLDGTALEHLYREHLVAGPLVATLLATPIARSACACIIVAVELALGPMLLWTPTRRIALVLALGFHAAVQYAVHPDVFGIGMATLLVCFLGARASAFGGPNAGATGCDGDPRHIAVLG